MKHEPDKMLSLIKAMSKDVFLKVIDLCDGHTIMAPEAFTKVGMDPELVKHFEFEHEAGLGKYAITDNDGNQMATCKGVYGLSLLERVAGCLGVKYMGVMGRGTQAEIIKEALKRYLENAL